MTIPANWWSEVGKSGRSPTEVAIAVRLRTAAPLLIGREPDPSLPDPCADAAANLDIMVEAVARQPTEDRIWLLLSALSAAYPTRNDVQRLRRRLELLPHRAATIFALEQSADLARNGGDPEAVLEIIDGAVIVDVDHSAKFDLHTGIQRVVRSVMPVWDRTHSVVPAAWSDDDGSLRPLARDETVRVLHWFDGTDHHAFNHTTTPTADAAPRRILVPWRSVVVMLEVPPGPAAPRLAALGDCSGNRLVGVIHDAIPVVSADMVPVEDSSKFVRYLTCAKFAHRMAGVSNSATAEMSGFVRALRTQGLRGPTVIEVPLGSPVPAKSDQTGTQRRSSRPTVLVVGSHEPRKNHLAILHCAEVLWREGLDFELVFVGGSGWGESFPRRVRELLAVDRPITIRRAIPDTELDEAYRTAWFTLFPSLHEGFGLPVAESIAHGTPVITSNFGSTAEIGAAGGALLVNPRDDTAITAAMRTLLTDQSALQQLEDQIRRRPVRSWEDYGVELWSAIVEPELADLCGRRT